MAFVLLLAGLIGAHGASGLASAGGEVPLDKERNDTALMQIRFPSENQKGAEGIYSSADERMVEQIGVEKTCTTCSGRRRALNWGGTWSGPGCDCQETVQICDGVTEIPHSALAGCTTLKRVTIPDSVTTIADYAFYRSSLEEVVVPDSVTSLGDSVFEESRSLTSARLPDSLTKIPRHTFRLCENLGDVTIPQSVTEIGYKAFEFSAAGLVTPVVIPYGVTKIDYGAFYRTKIGTNVEEFVIPDSVVELGGGVFAVCRSIKKIKLSRSLTVTGFCDFCDLDGVEYIEVPDSVTTIGPHAFVQHAGNLQYITLGRGVNSIGYEAFRNPSGKLEHIYSYSTAWSYDFIGEATREPGYYPNGPIPVTYIEDCTVVDGSALSVAYPCGCGLSTCYNESDRCTAASSSCSTVQTPTPATPSAGGAGAGASAVGDPHLQNIHGERFDLMKAGKHVLINIPRGMSAENALLRVQADARRLGGQCADMYFQKLNVTGSWAEAKQAGGYHYSVSERDIKAPEWVAFGKVELKVVHGRTDSGLLYLNLYVKHLGQAGFAVGGLLGEDDHEDVSVAPESCAQRLALVAGTRRDEGHALSFAVASLA